MQILGIDIGGTKTSVCVGDEKGKIRASQRMASQVEEGPQAWVGRLQGLIASVLDEVGVSLEQIDAAGVSAPGPLSVGRGMLLTPPNMTGWVDVPVVAMLGEVLPCPVYMNNDANAAALAEWYFGECRGADSLIYLTMSTGLGGGIIVNGRLIQGVTDTAGEVGYHVLDPNGPATPSGHPGSFESFCGGKNLADRLRARIVEEKISTAILDEAGGRPEDIDFKSFLAAVKAKDAFALEAWDEYIAHLAQGIGNLIMILNPEAIVLGTIGIHAGDMLLEPLKEALPRFVVKPALDACRIVPSALGTRIGDLAALAVAIAAEVSSVQ